MDSRGLNDAALQGMIQNQGASLESLIQVNRSSVGWQAETTKAPAPPTDPIAIAAMVAELPELEAAYKAAKEASDAALAKLNDMQLRIDRTISALKDHAPAGSRWSSADSSKFMEERAAYLAREIAKYAPTGVNGMPSGPPKKY